MRALTSWSLQTTLWLESALRRFLYCRLCSGWPQRTRPDDTPATLPVCCLRFFDGQLGDGVDDPVEVVFADGIDVGVGRGIHEVDGVGNAVFAGELDRVQVVAQRATEREGIAFSTRSSSLGSVCGRLLHVALMKRRRRIVVHDVHFLLADHVAAEVFLELHAALQGHAEIARSGRRRGRILPAS